MNESALLPGLLRIQDNVMYSSRIRPAGLVQKNEETKSSRDEETKNRRRWRNHAVFERFRRINSCVYVCVCMCVYSKYVCECPWLMWLQHI